MTCYSVGLHSSVLTEFLAGDLLDIPEASLRY